MMAGTRIDFDGFIIDLDGVVWLGGQPIADSVQALADLRARHAPVVFVTNDPTGSRAEYATRLTQIGIPTTQSQIVTSGSALAERIRQDSGTGAKAFVIGSSSLKQEFQAVGLELASAEPDVVAVAGHEGFNYDELRLAAQFVRRGALLYAAGRDATFPTSDGPWPATGSILAAVETAAGVRATVVGKPGPYMFELGRRLLEACRWIAVVGDHLEADIAGGKRAGLATVLVLSGVTSREEVVSAEVAPDLVVPDLASFVRALIATRTSGRTAGD
jgi:glycerol 3-phosphatase-2